MQIVPYEPEMAAGLAAVYNEAVRGVAHCYPAAVEDFASALAPAVGAAPGHKRLHSDAAFAATDGASAAGFVHAAVERAEVPGRERGIIRFLCYQRGRRAAGQMLLEAAEDYFRRRELKRVVAGWQQYCYPFYHLESAYLSDRLDHVHALLAMNDYRRCGGEVFLDWPDYDAREPRAADVPAEISVQWKPSPAARPGLTVRACQGETEIGVCTCTSAAELSGAAEAQDWVFTTWLGVSERMQGRGLGRYLLQRGLSEARGAGYRHAVISTAWDNYRAMLFYGNHGYRFVDWTYGLGRDLR